MIWEVDSPASAPVMFCAHEAFDVSDRASYAVIKRLVKRAKAEKVSVHAISISLDEEGTTGTLMGTRDDS